MRLFRQMVIVLALLLIAQVVAAEEKRFNVPLGASPVYGSKDAPVTIVEFIDYQ